MVSLNNSPTIDAVSDLDTTEDHLPITIPLTGVGPGENETQVFEVVAFGYDDGLIDVEVAHETGASTGTLLVSPLADRWGETTVNVAVMDGGVDNDLSTIGDNKQIVKSFQVGVAAVNDAPLVSSVDAKEVPEDAVDFEVNLDGIYAEVMKLNRYR